jgi:hypothetical protein
LAPILTALAAVVTGVTAVAALVFTGLSVRATNAQLKLNEEDRSLTGITLQSPTSTPPPKTFA